jgi:hypothetical protein
MISKSLRLSNGALYDPRLDLLPNVGGVPVNVAACGNSFTVQVARAFSIASHSGLLTTTLANIHIFPIVAAPFTPNSDNAADGPLLIESVVLVLTADVTFSDAATPTHFSIEVGMREEATWSNTANQLNTYKWVTTGEQVGTFSGAGVRPIASTVNVFASPVSVNGGLQSAFSRTADDTVGNIRSTFFGDRSTKLTVGATIKHQSGGGSATLAFDANFYITGRMLPPLINP